MIVGYVKNGYIERIHELFNKIRCNLLDWNDLGYAQNKNYRNYVFIKQFLGLVSCIYLKVHNLLSYDGIGSFNIIYLKHPILLYGNIMNNVEA